MRLHIRETRGGKAMKIVKLPSLNYEGLTVTEALIKLYIDLGWDPSNQLIEPTMVKLSEDDYNTLISILMLLEPMQEAQINLLLLNKGPSCGYEKVKNGTVHLYDGWVITEEKTF